MVQSCEPTYAYRPTFTPSNTPCAAPLYREHRSRVTATTLGGVGSLNTIAPVALFFRSHSFGFVQDQIAVEITETPPRFNVWNGSTIVEQYDVTFGPGSIALLRDQITNRYLTPAGPSIIDMTPLNYDVYDVRTAENDLPGVMPEPDGGLSPMAKVSLSGGEGAPEDSGAISVIRTGPDRSVFILISTEDNQGNDITPPASRRIKQWDGDEWLSYCNNVAGQCPGEGTC